MHLPPQAGAGAGPVVVSGADFNQAPLPFVPALTSALSPLQMSQAEWKSLRQTKATKTPPESFIYRSATVADAVQIAQIGAEVFASTFGYSLLPEDLTAYLENSYTTAAIEKDVADPHKHFLIACPASTPSAVLAFVQLTEHSSEPCLAHLPQDTLVELQRLYVADDEHGKGLGKALIEKIEDKAREMGFVNIWLGVWEDNFIAQKVYEKAGYKKVGTHDFVMGRCVQTDEIMTKPL